MSRTRELERELEQMLATSGYEVRFEHANGYGWFYVYVVYEGRRVAEKSCCRSYPRAARWAKRQVRSHAQAIGILGPLWKPKKPAGDRVPA